MDETESDPAADQGDQALIQCLIDELTAVPVANAMAPSRTLEIPRDCLLHEWTELYWTALQRPDFLYWASQFDLNLDTFSPKGETLQALTASLTTPTLRIFTLEDDSGWWQMAPVLLSISQRIDPAGIGLPCIGGKSANPQSRFPRRLVLAFYGYPEPQNTQQAQVIVNELKSSAIAPINNDGYTASAVIKERTAQLEDYRVIAAELEQALQTVEERKQPFVQFRIAATSVSLTSDSLIAKTESELNLGYVITRYGFELPANAKDTRELILQLRQAQWPLPPFVSGYVQTNLLIRHYQEAFADIENCQYIIGRLEALSWNKESSQAISLEEFSRPEPASTLGRLVARHMESLLKFRSNPAFQAILKGKNLPPDSQLLVTESGRVGTADNNHKWIALKRQVERHAGLKVLLEQLKTLAGDAGGEIRTNGKVSLVQMMRYYEMDVPENAGAARTTAQWEKTLLILHPVHMDHWYLLGPPGNETEQFTSEERQLIIDTTAAFLPSGSAPLIDYLNEGIATDLPRSALRAKADYLFNQILSAPRAQDLGNQLLSKFRLTDMAKALDAINRERLVLAALILSLDPSMGKHTRQVIGQPLNDRFFWGESFSEVRRFIDGQPDLTLVRNKVLATHLMLSGIAPEFLVRDIPQSVGYMSSCRWVMLKQMVLYVEQLKAGLARVLTFEQLMTLAKHPPPQFQTFRAGHACTLVLVEWAIARGLIRSEPDLDVSTYDSSTLEKAGTAFRAHTQQLDQLCRDGFHPVFPTPYTVALADLRSIFPNHRHLEDKVLVWTDAIAVPQTDPPQYSLVDLHMANRLMPDMTGWNSRLAQLNLETMTPQFSRLKKVCEQFSFVLTNRLAQMKKASLALIKEAFCELPLQQRIDIEDSTLELFALSPVPQPGAAVKPRNDTGPFTIIALLRDYTPRVFEVFVRHSQVQLRRDIDWRLLTPTADSAAPPSLAIDGDAYLRGTRPKNPASSKVRIERLTVEGALFARQPVTVPDTFSSAKVNAIAQAAVNQLYKVHEAAALERAMTAVDLKDTETCHSTWMAFYQALSPSE
ncbi:hypothetical protein [Pseudomonas fluorescens]|uniref:hypothetical protein n=1 Tax=Pseudomonas fluorescens TaxID=294 RepID=UPI0012415F81|nr:hypothetical protein [Pseudomonas fluorescens]VVP39853.1 hypothetical protein PS898_04761 [Pseudomonas fluorescens]